MAERISVQLNPALWMLDEVELAGKTFRRDEPTELTEKQWEDLSSRRSIQGGVSHQTLCREGQGPDEEPVWQAEPVIQPDKGEEETHA